MESLKLRKLTFLLFFTLVPFSCLNHWPLITGQLAGIMHWAGFVILSITVPLAIYIHSLFPKRHDGPGDFDKLMTDGPYRYFRRPFYSAFIVMGFGIGLFCVSVPGLTAYALLLPLWRKLAEVEERELLEYWGEEYRRFMERRGRFFPKLNKSIQQTGGENENL
ncbi:isoprenylcysteine carboxylmethyltransferase family protein [Thermococcus sp.]|uniref:methyltransferase family protein n=1 Tax=Thermococcus sp. TaxID=35749 RepID=UPI002624D71C|nr:isoprenylcysteine carboxylmethyltransferase family protein [Thermococcus sp.]